MAQRGVERSERGSVPPARCPGSSIREADSQYKSQMRLYGGRCTGHEDCNGIEHAQLGINLPGTTEALVSTSRYYIAHFSTSLHQYHSSQQIAVVIRRS
eukprot:2780320-Rhodomonas_salina.1